jgi:isoleucyl-tRNA synthetase
MEYKETLNLPRTDFAMKADLVAREPEHNRSKVAGPAEGWHRSKR